jgi:thioredoxin 1
MACHLSSSATQEGAEIVALPEITGETFAAEVLAADQPVLVDFWGPRCQPCIALMPAVEALANEHAGRLKVVKVNANARPNWELCRQHSVMGLPAYLFFQNGQEWGRITGPNITKETLAQSIHELLAGAQEAS